MYCITSSSKDWYVLMSKNQRILSTPMWKKVRLKVLARDNYHCVYCDETANEVDHIVPLAVDTSDPYNMDNLVAACRRCNNLKGAKDKHVFLRRGVTPPVFVENISPRGGTTTIIYQDFGQIGSQ